MFCMNFHFLAKKIAEGRARHTHALGTGDLRDPVLCGHPSSRAKCPLWLVINLSWPECWSQGRVWAWGLWKWNCVLL